MTFQKTVKYLERLAGTLGMKIIPQSLCLSSERRDVFFDNLLDFSLHLSSNVSTGYFLEKRCL
jgi:hypothetical protein